jgi:CheY-like chemotaxis protein
VAKDGRQVLVVDDDPDIHAIVGHSLANAGYVVKTASDGHEALAILSDWQPDVILLDLAMPGMNGWTFLAIQQVTAALARIPVIVMSAAYTVQTLQKPQGTAAALAKPFAIEHLLAEVKAVVNGREPLERSPGSAHSRGTS